MDEFNSENKNIFNDGLSKFNQLSETKFLV
jgi:hypothetical protein